LPVQLGDVGQYPYITQGLLGRGHKPATIKKVLGENLMRAFGDAEAVTRVDRRGARR
jgi:microsomal dipeptidase-like Zn-dependent dipeptidase